MRLFTKHVVLLTVLLLTVIGVRANISLNKTANNNTTTTYVRTVGSSDIVKWIDAGDVTVEIDYRNEVATVIAAAEKYKEDMTIPEEAIEWMNDPAIGLPAVSNRYPIHRIASDAFQNCTELNSLIIPKSITMVGIDGAYFSGCTSLKAINVDPENRFYSSINGVLYNKDQTTLIYVPGGLTSVDIPSTVKQIGPFAFSSCKGLKSIVIPNSVTSIAESAFESCTNLASLEMPNVTTIGTSAFSGCTNLTSVEMPKIITIGTSAFSDCTGLTSIEFPASLTVIGDRVFSGCTGLTSVVIPRSVYSLWDSSFDGCTNLKTAVIYSSYTGFAFTNAEEVYYLHPDAIISDASTVESFTGTIYGTQQVLDQFTSPDIQKVKLYALKKEATLGTVTLTVDSLYSKLQLGDALVQNYSEAKVERNDNEYNIGGLLPGRTYQMQIDAQCNGISVSLPIEIETQTPVIPIPKIVERTQTTITVNISAPVDESFPVVELQIYGETIDYKGGTQRVVLRNLIPGKDDYVFRVYAYYGDYPWNYASFSSKNIECSTLPLLSTAPSVVSLTPTTVKVSATYLEGDAHVTEVDFSKFYRNNRVDPYNELGTSGLEIFEEDGNTILETSGLKPGQQHWGWFYVITEEGGKDSILYTFTTPALKFETLPAKATSNTVALICAETNLSDRETGAGFEWRRYDAPDLVPSTKSPCPVVDGMLTGALRNLSASTYYKFRPYYTSASGETYYGEWLAFGTADAYVYFDPTVRTYEATGVTATEARVRGYAIAGSDDITEQGFEYWPTGTVSKRSATDVQRVQVTGQFMTATLEDLQPGTEYTFRVYVETAKGTTYGEEQTFTTADGTTDISATTADADGSLQVAVRGNLSEGHASVRVSGNGGEAVWTLRGIGGATAAQGRMRADGSWQTLDAPAQPRGIYLLTVGDGQRTRTMKLVAH